MILRAIDKSTFLHQIIRKKKTKQQKDLFRKSISFNICPYTNIHFWIRNAGYEFCQFCQNHISMYVWCEINFRPTFTVVDWFEMFRSPFESWIYFGRLPSHAFDFPSTSLNWVELFKNSKKKGIRSNEIHEKSFILISTIKFIFKLTKIFIWETNNLIRIIEKWYLPKKIAYAINPRIPFS